MSEIACGQCGRVIVIEASRVDRTVFCSRTCNNVAKLHRRTRTCAYPECGRTFTAKISRDQKYCCAECYYDDISIPIRPLAMSELERSQVEAIALEYDVLVGSVARKLYAEYAPRIMELADFEQEGRYGLLTAIVQDDDPTQAERFPGFAKSHIRYAIIKAYREQEHAIRLPVSLFRSDAKIAPAQLEHFKQHAHALSLDALPVEGRYTPRADSSIEECVIELEARERLYDALLTLPPQQRTCIIEHFGLVGEPTAMLQLCHKYGVPRVTMWRTIHRGLDALSVRMRTW